MKTSIFKNPFTITFLFQICSKQCAMNWLIGKCHTCEIWSVSPGTKWKSHFLCGAALCCVESRASWLEGVLVSTSCAAFYSACVYPSRNCPSVCLSHITLFFRDLEKYILPQIFLTSPPLSGWSYQGTLAWECHIGYHTAGKPFLLCWKSYPWTEASWVRNNHSTQLYKMLCILQCLCVLLLSLFDQQQAWVQLAFAEVCFLWTHRDICINN